MLMRCCRKICIPFNERILNIEITISKNIILIDQRGIREISIFEKISREGYARITIQKQYYDKRGM